MAKERALFELVTQNEIENWYEAWQDELERLNFKESKEPEILGSYLERVKEAGVSRVVHLRDFVQEAEPGQRIVLRRKDWLLAKKVGALPERLIRTPFEDMPEGIPQKTFTRGREILPGVYEKVKGMVGMHKVGEKPSKVEFSRADIERALRKMGGE